MSIRNAALFLMMTVSVISTVSGQSGYFLAGTRSQPDLYLTDNPVRMTIASNREDVKAIGQGKTQIANGLMYNAMLENPALLSEVRTSYDLPSVMASIPERSLPALMYLKDHSDQFSRGTFLRQIHDGVVSFQSATDDAQRYAALRQIQEGLRFPDELQQEVGATDGDPRMHGLSLIPNFQVQSGNFGLALYAAGQLGFIVRSSSAVSALAQFPMPANISELTPSDLFRLASIVEPLFDGSGNIKPEALPSTYAISYLDMVGVAGYGMHLTPDLSVGINLKIINRRFSSKWVDANNYDNMLDQVRDDFQASATGYTVDLGGLYFLESARLRLGGVIQNLLPVQKLSSQMTVRRLISGFEYARDTNNAVVVVNGDTGLVDVQQVIQTTTPYELEEPVIVSVGATRQLNENWDVSLDWVDIAAQDERHSAYLSRFRIGTEYRLDAMHDLLGVALRAGLADNHPTFGVGLNLFRVLQMDGAYAYNTFISENSYFAQLRVGW